MSRFCLHTTATQSSDKPSYRKYRIRKLINSQITHLRRYFLQNKILGCNTEVAPEVSNYLPCMTSYVSSICDCETVTIRKP